MRDGGGVAGELSSREERGERAEGPGSNRDGHGRRRPRPEQTRQRGQRQMQMFVGGAPETFQRAEGRRNGFVLARALGVR